MAITATEANQTGAEEIRCIRPDCARVLARAVSFCPYCGGAQTEKPVEVAPSNPIVFPPPPQVHIKPEQQPAPKPPEKKPQPQNKPKQQYEPKPEPAMLQTPPDPPPPQTETPKPTRPGGRFRSKYIVWALVLAIAGWWIFVHGKTPKPVDVTANAAPNWTSVDLDTFKEGAEIVVTADAPFRMRSTDMPPILVRAKNGDVTLDRIHRKGLEVKSTNDEPVHIRFSPAKP